MVRSLALVALLGATASASYHGNLNYRSPSSAHPALGMDVVKIVNRNLVKRDDTGYDPATLQFTHSVASVRTPLHA
jgi:alkaline phosphatase D